MRSSAECNSCSFNPHFLHINSAEQKLANNIKTKLAEKVTTSCESWTYIYKMKGRNYVLGKMENISILEGGTRRG